MSSEPMAANGLELIESVGGKCPNRHPAIWRVLRSAEKPIEAQWFKCDICSATRVAKGTLVWPETVVEALAALAAKPPKAKTVLRVIDRA